jgi:hypothetical protein
MSVSGSVVALGPAATPPAAGAVSADAARGPTLPRHLLPWLWSTRPSTEIWASESVLDMSGMIGWKPSTTCALGSTIERWM